MNVLEKKFNWYVEKGKKGKKHRGIKRIKPSKELAKEHIEKAFYNLRAANTFSSNNFTDWAVAAYFYAMYHALLAILYKLGYESRNQDGTITAIEFFIEKSRLKIEKEYIEMIKATKEMKGEDAKTLREEFQYGTETRVNKTILDLLAENAKKFVERMQVELESL